MRQVAVLGVGMTKFGRSEKSALQLFVEAASQAVRDSNLSPRNIEAVFLGTVFAAFADGQANIAPFAADAIGAYNVPATRFEGACASASVALRDAYQWVASGAYDVVVAGGTERLLVLETSMATRLFAMGSDSAYEVPAGITFPAVFAMIANLYARHHGVPLPKLKEQMAMVAVKAHENAMANPLAQFHKAIRIEDVLGSAMVASPLQLYDCCPFSDGAAAVVLAEATVARRLVKAPVFIAGVGQASAGPLYTQHTLPRVVARELSAKKAFDMAGISPRDVDVVELHDCFTIAEILATEALGLFEYGEGGTAVEKGLTRIRGRVAVNPSGGLKAKGHPIGATGAAQVYEVVKQLRGECGQRQVDGARIGLTDTLGGDLSTVVNFVLTR